MLTGGCFCGAIRYEASGPPFHATLCHCDDCRKVVGAPAVAWFSVRRSTYRITAGSPKRFASSDHAERSFCATCGSSLTFESRGETDEIDVTICSLDEPDLLAPADHTYMTSRTSWWDALPRLPSLPGSRSDD